MKHGKKYTEAAKLVDRATFYEPGDAIALVKKTATAKFDETIEAGKRSAVPLHSCDAAGHRNCSQTLS